MCISCRRRRSQSNRDRSREIHVIDEIRVEALCCWMHVVFSAEIDALGRGSRVFIVPGPAGVVCGPIDRLRSPPEMAALGG